MEVLFILFMVGLFCYCFWYTRIKPLFKEVDRPQQNTVYYTERRFSRKAQNALKYLAMWEDGKLASDAPEFIVKQIEKAYPLEE